MIKIYTAGKMNGLSYEQQLSWRMRFQTELENRSDQLITFIHPPLFYNYGATRHKTEREVMEWELNQIRTCDIVVVNLNEVNSTTGTHMELGFINAMNMIGNKHIYVVGIGSTRNVHPWIECSMLRVEPTIESACDYIAEYLLM